MSKTDAGNRNLDPDSALSELHQQLERAPTPITTVTPALQPEKRDAVPSGDAAQVERHADLTRQHEEQPEDKDARFIAMPPSD